MKRTTLLAMAAALMMGSSAFAQNQEVTYVEDSAQGYLINKFKDNWFITVEGGANILFSHSDSNLDLKDRFSPQAAIYVGKWFTPVVGARVGATWLQTRGLSDSAGSPGVYLNEAPVKGQYYKQRFNSLGPAADIMFNLTNWFCGYKPNRVYNAELYAGLAAYWSWAPNFKDNAGTPERDGWKATHDRIMGARLGLINSFRIGKAAHFFIDLRWAPLDNFHCDEIGNTSRRFMHDVQANLGFTFDLGRNSWSAPVVPVCPEPENCDALRARLAAADARIADLEAQLRECLNRPVPECVCNPGPLATIYFPCNVSKLTRKDINVLGAVAEVMKGNPDKTYTLTGWADNYTGTDAINVRLRQARAAGVEKQLIKFGVPQSQITATTDNGNLCDMGEKYVALDRAVTIAEN